MSRPDGPPTRPVPVPRQIVEATLRDLASPRAPETLATHVMARVHAIDASRPHLGDTTARAARVSADPRSLFPAQLAMAAALWTVAAYAPPGGVAELWRPVGIGLSAPTPGGAVLVGGLLVYAVALFSSLGPGRT